MIDTSVLFNPHVARAIMERPILILIPVVAVVVGFITMAIDAKHNK